MESVSTYFSTFRTNQLFFLPFFMRQESFKVFEAHIIAPGEKNTSKLNTNNVLHTRIMPFG